MFQETTESVHIFVSSCLKSGAITTMHYSIKKSHLHHFLAQLHDNYFEFD